MKYHYVLLLLFFQFHNYVCGSKPQSSNHLIQEGEKHFKNLRQLTFSGENAEAYFSSEGKKLILQAHDGDSLCDQIYIMNIAS